MANNTSQHILNTSANLLGFCLFVISSVHFRNKAETTIIDKITSIVAILLAMSCFYSFLSIRTKNELKEKKYENFADYLFVSSLAGILMIILLISFNFIK
jgi:hypothetical protein